MKEAAAKIEKWPTLLLILFNRIIKEMISILKKFGTLTKEKINGRVLKTFKTKSINA